ncbi:hypothetical protein GH810_05270 [Acetobacterium paludosum]|uniref:Uncharacterized protein n=1 Tax=Acetobacterium paludosum TaxID=52693 RepID=A0A923I261_9FIRM|nr:hypothetical protein [Acetobacterium paludosum]MBC3887715.1 hypothetical protein [Acetobacterium paludosum]
MKEKKNERKRIGKEIFDSLFIMILCFSTLLSAMLLKNKSMTGIDYTIYSKTFFVTVLGLIAYLVYMINRSERGLKAMIQVVYFDESIKEMNKK